MDETFSVVFESDILRVKEIVGEALQFLNGALPAFSKDAAYEIKLIISEALLNAVKHGNDCDRRKKVSLKIKVRADASLTILIQDEGAGFDYEKVMAREITNESLLLESGRGIRLVNMLSDNVCYNKKGNKLKIHKKVVY